MSVAFTKIGEKRQLLADNWMGGMPSIWEDLKILILLPD
jgi:hypothetical protein